MGRLLAAVLILLGAVLGLTAIRSPSIRQGFLNQFGATPQTQMTGFSTTVPADGSPIAQAPQTTRPTSRPQTTRPTTRPATGTNGGNTEPGQGTRPLQPVPGGW